MMTRAWGNEYRTTTVCVDSYENGVLSGRFYNPYLAGGKVFRSLTQFLLEIEQALDTMDFPRSYTETRTFDTPHEIQSECAEDTSRSGQLATFALKILFRQNASWQGSVQWLEKGKGQSFRSVLELIMLMDSALNSAAEE